jgi:hypothetical protein
MKGPNAAARRPSGSAFHRFFFHVNYRVRFDKPEKRTLERLRSLRFGARFIFVPCRWPRWRRGDANKEETDG